MPDIYAVWESQGWENPIVEEQYDPDRTILRLAFTKKQAEKTTENGRTMKRTLTQVWSVGQKTIQCAQFS